VKNERPEGEGFLSRWARRKQAAKAPVVEQVPSAPVFAEEAPAVTGTEEAPALPEIELPDLASVGADTDITPYLKAGVPDWWKNAAMRKVWAETPAIRDFRGLQDYDWNFNDPDSIPGFASTINADHARSMIENLFSPVGEPEQQVAKALPPATASDAAAAAENLPEPQSVRLSTDPGASDHDGVEATDDIGAQMLSSLPIPPQHGEGGPRNESNGVASAGEPPPSPLAPPPPRIGGGSAQPLAISMNAPVTVEHEAVPRVMRRRGGALPV
jgi:Protein of unknown function (DUF3306)